MQERFEFQITEIDYKKRLDEFLFNAFPNLSRLYLRELVRDGKCEVNGRFENRGYLLKTQDFVEIEIDRTRNTSLQPEPIPLEIVFEDSQIIVVNKPAGMLVHPTIGVRTGTLLNALAHYLNFSKNETSDFKRAGLIHRLDKDTSGLLLISKTPRAHRILSNHFKRKLVEKKYFAVVEGIVEKTSGTIDAPIGRFEKERVWNIKEDGKNAVTNFWVKERFADKTLLELEPVTGRTNQLRIHLAYIGNPILGDKKYGGGEFSRLCLHAYKLKFWSIDGGEMLEFISSLPKEMDLKNCANSK